MKLARSHSGFREDSVKFSLKFYREARSAIRVQQGIVEVAEQVQYLEKVAGAQESLIKNEAQIMENRLKLVGMCDPVNAPTINAWLTKVSAVPGRIKRALQGGSAND